MKGEKIIVESGQDPRQGSRMSVSEDGVEIALSD